MNGSTELSSLQEIVFSDSTLLGYFISGIVYFLLPAAAFLLLKRYNAARIFPVITGVAVYALSTRCCDIFTHMATRSQSIENQRVIAAELVCVFEEAGRWLAMRYPVTDIRKPNAAVCYGIGHAGLECWIRGFQKFRIFRYGQQLNSKGLAVFLSGKTAEKAAAAADQLKAYADHPLYLSLFDILDSIAAFGFHIAVSLFIFRKMTETGFQKRWLLAAILMHYCMNGFTWLASLSGDPLFTDLAGIITGTGIIIVICKVIPVRTCIDEIRFPLKTD